ncbi:uncharacterized protein LOC143285699 [Babylonia areolata]|uniref:uncharacterized protein LOC143285699 n=1 Tax=Babylonia areolata TaxID=304850 RepID=UPI003FCFE9E9
MSQTRQQQQQPEYVGWEPSDLLPHARQFQNQPRPEQYVGWEPSDLLPHARQFKPQADPEPRPEPERNPPCMRSLVHDSYKPLPENEYSQLENAHKGPLSRTVTLTTPFNPFNKLQYYV